MKYTVLIVEDEQIVRKELEQNPLFGKLGLTVICSCDNGIDGERLIREKGPDIIISDIRLPGQDGLTMLKNTQSHNAIILSGHSDFEYMRRAILIGVSDYIKKPIDDQELIDSLSRLTKKIRNEEQEMAHLGSHSLPSYIIPLPSKVKNHVIDNAICFIEKNYKESIGLQEAAQHLHVSESHLSRLFKEITGINFMGYLNAYRMNKAVTLMHDPKLNISMVCSLSGFPTPGYFAKLFRRFHSMTPTHFRDTVLPPS